MLKRDFLGAIELCKRMESDESVIRLLAACHGLAGDIPAAREYGTRIMENYPDVSAAALAQIPPNKLDIDRQMFFEGLRLAGIK